MVTRMVPSWAQLALSPPEVAALVGRERPDNQPQHQEQGPDPHRCLQITTSGHSGLWPWARVPDMSPRPNTGGHDGSTVQRPDRVTRRLWVSAEPGPPSSEPDRHDTRSTEPEENSCPRQAPEWSTSPTTRSPACSSPRSRTRNRWISGSRSGSRPFRPTRCGSCPGGSWCRSTARRGRCPPAPAGSPARWWTCCAGRSASAASSTSIGCRPTWTWPTGWKPGSSTWRAACRPCRAGPGSTTGSR